jgi:hypothetical protein
MSIGKNLSYISQQKLIDYVKNPELAAAASIPAASALFELQQRVVKDKELAALKAKEAMAQGPQSVADKTIAASQEQGLPAAMNFAQNNQPMDDGGGVASLDTGDMYQEQNFAGGGIVAFDDGGDVDLKTRSRFDTLTNEEKQIIAAQYGLGADLGNQRGSIGAEYAGIVNQQGVSAPRGELRGRYMTDQGNEYSARYMPDARALGIDRNAGRTSVGADVAPGPDNSMGLRSIRGSYITDDGTRYGAGYNVDTRQALLEQINKEGNSLGLNVSRDGVGVQGQYRFAEGGDVKRFAYGAAVKTDPERYDPFYYKDAAAALVPTRKLPTAGEYFEDQRSAEKELGVDPDYYAKRMKEVAAATAEETDSAKRLANANILFAMADTLSSTPGPILRGLSRAAPAGLKAGTEALKDLRELEKTKREAENKLRDAEYSQKRGDAQGYMKNINEYKTLNTNIELKNAELETSMRIANYKARAEKTGKGYEIYDKAVDNAQKAFDKDYPDAALTEATGGDAAKLGLIRKQYIERELRTLMGDIEGAYGASPAVAQPSVAQPGVNRRPITEFAGS